MGHCAPPESEHVKLPRCSRRCRELSRCALPAGVQRIGRLRPRQRWLNDMPGRLCLPCRRRPGALRSFAGRSGRTGACGPQWPRADCRRDSVRRRDGCGMALGCAGRGAAASPQSLCRRNRRTVAAAGATGAPRPHTGPPASSNSRSCPAAAWARCLRLAWRLDAS